MHLDDVATLCDEFPTVVRGIELAEVRFQGPYTNFGGDTIDVLSYNARNVVGAIQLAASRGLLVLLQIDFLRWAHVLADVALQPLLTAIRAHPQHVIPINEMIAPNALLRHTSVMGLWLSDAVDAFGMEPQSWYVRCSSLLVLVAWNDPCNAHAFSATTFWSLMRVCICACLVYHLCI